MKVKRSNIKVGEKIAQGGYAEIFQCTYQGKEYVLRQLKGDLLFKRKIVNQFLDGIRHRKTSSDNDHIVKFVGYGGNRFIKPFELIERQNKTTLKDIIVQKHRFAVSKPLDLLINCAQGLKHVHDCNLIHLDIKPENYLLSLNPEPGNYLKLTDFDLTIPATTSYLDSVTSGSLMYLPLEHIRRKKVSKATDVYSFGVMAYNLYCYQTPFMKSVDEIADDYQIKYPSGFEERIPQEIRDFIEKCMHKFPEERFINGDSLLDSLLSIQRKLNKEKSTVHGQKEKGS